MKAYKIIKECSFGEFGEVYVADSTGRIQFYRCKPYLKIIDLHEIDMLLALGFIEVIN